MRAPFAAVGAGSDMIHKLNEFAECGTLFEQRSDVNKLYHCKSSFNLYDDSGEKGKPEKWELFIRIQSQSRA